MANMILSTIAASPGDMPDMWDITSSEVSTRVPEDHYTDAQKKLVNSPLYKLLRQQVIDDMEAYAKDHGLYNEEQPSPLPSALFKRGTLWNWNFIGFIGYIKICVNDALFCNPYKVVPLVYLVCMSILVMSIAIKIWVIFHVVGRRWAIHSIHGAALSINAKAKLAEDKDASDVKEKIWDTTASVLPIAVTLVLFLFPPLLANL